MSTDESPSPSHSWEGSTRSLCAQVLLSAVSVELENPSQVGGAPQMAKQFIKEVK